MCARGRKIETRKDKSAHLIATFNDNAANRKRERNSKSKGKGVADSGTS